MNGSEKILVSTLHIFARLALVGTLAASLAACGGGAGGGNSMPATSPIGNGVSDTNTPVVPSISTSPSTIASASVTTATTGDTTTSGKIVSTFSTGFTLNQGAPHGYLHVYTSSSTAFSGSKPFIGEQVSVAGTGSVDSSITAKTVTQAGSATPSPAPTDSPGVTPPNGSSNTPLMSMAKSKIGLIQVFDAWGSPRVSSSAAQADGSRYGVIWGARPGMASNWRANNPSLLATYYMPQETDASTGVWGGIGHNLAWWEANHPDWILYTCTADGTPTKTPAYIAGLTTNVPLDIHNPAVVDYQVRLAANYAINNGYNGVAYDEVIFYNETGASAGPGYYGCGIYQNGSFVRRYSGKTDPKWNDDTAAWVKAAHTILNTDSTIAPHHLKLVVNHPAGNVGSADEQTILANVDADLNETGYADYGNYTRSSGLFKATLDWTRYAQAHGVAPLTIDKFEQASPISGAQLEYSIATYMMGNEGGSGLFVGNARGYGVEQYHSEYANNYGTACGGYYGGSSSSPDLYYRKYSNAFVIVNGGSRTETASIPSGHSYRDLEGRSVTSSIGAHDAYVLLTSSGCN